MEQFQADLSKVSDKFHKEKHRLPKDIVWKLQYMLDCISRTAKPISQLTEQQRNEVKDLEDMTPGAIAYAFSTIVNSILSPVLYCSFQKNCRIKLEGMMPRWVRVYLSFEENQITFTNRKKVFKFAVEDLQCHKISATQLQFKYKGVRKSKIRFDNPNAAQNAIGIIEMLIQQHKKNKRKLNGQDEILNQKNYQQILSHQYHVEHRSNQDIFMTHKTEPKIHISMFMKGQFWDIYQLIEFFITQKNWNSRVVDQKVFQYGPHLLVERRMQSTEFFSLERRTLTQVTFQKKGQSSFMIEEKNYPSTPTSKHIIVSDIHIKALFQILSPKIVKITLDCLFNAKGYCNRTSSKSMLVDLFHDAIQMQQKYRKMKQKGKLHFKLALIDRIKQEQSSERNYKKQEIVVNMPEEQQIYYSVATNRRYLQNAVDQIEQELRKNREEFYDMNNLDDAELESGSSTEEKSCEGKYMEKKQIQKQITTQKIGNQQPQSEENLQKKCQQYEKVKPHSFDQKISLPYIIYIKEKIFEKNYLKKFFVQTQLKTFLWQTPWYDPSLIIPNGKEYEVSKKNELVFINYQLIKNQKDSLIFVIKQVGANLISGKSVLNVSLPVDIFESRSLLQRSAASFGCAPKFLKPVAEAGVYTQMKAIIGFMLSVSPLQLIMLKPFNPILGETFQAYIGGVPICYEQISHHPPISAYYMSCDEFTIYGNLVAVANVSLNSGSGGNAGKMNIVMKNGNKFEVSFFPGQISGLIYGKRKYSICSKSFVIQRDHQLVAQVSSNKEQRGLYEWKQLGKIPTSGDLIGRIFKVKQKFLHDNPPLKSMMYHSGLKKNDIEQKKDLISGLWFSKITIGDQIINPDHTAYPVQYANQVLPSDSNFRMDILMHKFNDLARSQTQKQLLQAIQRNDRKLRQANEKLKTT